MRVTTFQATIILLLAALSGCKEQALTGDYQSRMPGRVGRTVLWLRGFEAITASITLSLLPDGSFRYVTCGHIKEGRYSLRDGGIVLQPEEVWQWMARDSAKWVNLDSFPEQGQAIYFERHGSRLVNTDYNRYNLLARTAEE